MDQTDSTGLKLLKSKSDELLRLFAEKEAAKTAADEATSAYEVVRREMAAMLQAAGVESLEHDGRLIYLRTRTSVRVPKTEQGRETFFNYLEHKGILKQMMTVHSNTLNSWYQSEYELAAERGDQDFSIPGIDEHTERVSLEVKKGRAS